MSDISTTSLTLLQISNDLASVNSDYLTISVTILLAVGGFFYLFNLRPIEEQLKKAEIKITEKARSVFNQS